MTLTTKKKQTKKVAETIVEQTAEPEDQSPQKVTNPFDEVQSRAHTAYLAYLEAQKDVANAYRTRDRQDQEAFKEVEREAYKNYDKDIEKALRDREKVEQEADELCRSAKERAVQVYQEKLMQALISCKGTIDEAWKASRETSEQMWTLFQVANNGEYK